MTTNAFQTGGSANYTGPDMLSTLPTELREHVVVYLRQADDEARCNTTDLPNIRLACKAMHEIVTPHFFRELSVTFHLTEALPLGSLQWARPKMLDGLHGSPGLATLCKRLQVRIEPFPYRATWSDEAFTAMVERLDEIILSRPDPFYGKTRMRTFVHQPSKPEARQDWVIQAYARLYIEAHHRPFLADVQPLLQELVQLLPNMEHVQSAPWHLRPRLKTHVELHSGFYPYLSLAYAVTMLLGMLPASVSSVGLRSMPSASPHICPPDMANQPFVLPSTSLSDRTYVDCDLRRLGPLLHGVADRLQKLSIDVSAMQLFMEDDSHNGQPAMPWQKDTAVYWQGIVTRLHGPRELHLMDPHPWSDRAFIIRSRMLDLTLLFRGLLLPNVLHLHLRKWVVPRSMVSKELWQTFPNIEHLVMEEVVISGGSEEAWHAALSALPERVTHRREVNIEVKGPRWCVVRDTHKLAKAADVSEADTTSLRKVVRGHPQPQHDWVWDQGTEGWVIIGE